MYENQIRQMIDNLTLNECIAVLAICAPDILETVYDDLMNDPDKDAAAVRARKIVAETRLQQEKNTQ